MAPLWSEEAILGDMEVHLITLCVDNSAKKPVPGNYTRTGHLSAEEHIRYS